jgi:hypothetical protein
MDPVANKTTNDGSLQSTKQMLDELDALMERMLSLPVNDLEDAPAFPKIVVKTPTLTATMTPLEAPPPVPVKAPAAMAEPLPHPAFNPPHFLVSEAEPESSAEKTAPVPINNDVVPPSLLSKMEPLLAPIPAESAPVMTSSCYRALMWVNQTFDQATWILGGAGFWLRGQGARMMFGLSGVGLLLASAGWFLKDWMGWNW